MRVRRKCERCVLCGGFVSRFTNSGLFTNDCLIRFFCLVFFKLTVRTRIRNRMPRRRRRNAARRACLASRELSYDAFVSPRTIHRASRYFGHSKIGMVRV